MPGHKDLVTPEGPLDCPEMLATDTSTMLNNHKLHFFLKPWIIGGLFILLGFVARVAIPVNTHAF